MINVNAYCEADLLVQLAPMLFNFDESSTRPMRKDWISGAGECRNEPNRITSLLKSTLTQHSDDYEVAFDRSVATITIRGVV